MPDRKVSISGEQRNWLAAHLHREVTAAAEVLLQFDDEFDAEKFRQASTTITVQGNILREIGSDPLVEDERVWFLQEPLVYLTQVASLVRRFKEVDFDHLGKAEADLGRAEYRVMDAEQETSAAEVDARHRVADGHRHMAIACSLQVALSPREESLA